MNKLKLLVGAALLCAAINCNAQGYSNTTIRPMPFGGGYNVNTFYSTGGYSNATIRPMPFGGGYNVNTYYSTGGYSNGTIQPVPFNGGLNVHTMPLFNH